MQVMPVGTEIQAAALAHGLRVKRTNALVAAITGGSLALLLIAVFSFKPFGFLCGLGAGLVYANAFEYFFHRFLLHLRSGYLAQQHDVHHSTWGTPDEMRYANFARTPWAVVLLFALNALPVLAIEFRFRAGLGPGMLIAFVLYFIAFEEIHWRIHLGSRLPSWLRFAARHHLAHHAGAGERFNVFLPLFDSLFRLAKR